MFSIYSTLIFDWNVPYYYGLWTSYFQIVKVLNNEKKYII